MVRLGQQGALERKKGITCLLNIYELSRNPFGDRINILFDLDPILVWCKRDWTKWREGSKAESY